MPICDDPNAFGYYTLKADLGKPVATRPMFKVKFFTRAKFREIARDLDEARVERDDAKCFEKVMGAIRKAVTGWVNVKDDAGNDLPFTDENVAARLHDLEIWELANSMGMPVTLSGDDQKNFASPA